MMRVRQWTKGRDKFVVGTALFCLALSTLVALSKPPPGGPGDEGGRPPGPRPGGPGGSRAHELWVVNTDEGTLVKVEVKFPSPAEPPRSSHPEGNGEPEVEIKTLFKLPEPPTGDSGLAVFPGGPPRPGGPPGPEGEPKRPRQADGGPDGPGGPEPGGPDGERPRFAYKNGSGKIFLLSGDGTVVEEIEVPAAVTDLTAGAPSGGEGPLPPGPGGDGGRPRPRSAFTQEPPEGPPPDGHPPAGPILCWVNDETNEITCSGPDGKELKAIVVDEEGNQVDIGGGLTGAPGGFGPPPGGGEGAPPPQHSTFASQHPEGPPPGGHPPGGGALSFFVADKAKNVIYQVRAEQAPPRQAEEPTKLKVIETFPGPEGAKIWGLAFVPGGPPSGGGRPDGGRPPRTSHPGGDGGPPPDGGPQGTLWVADANGNQLVGAKIGGAPSRIEFVEWILVVPLPFKPGGMDTSVGAAEGPRPRPEGKCTVLGRVVGPDEKPVKNARVKIKTRRAGGASRQGKTDADGHFRITKVSEGPAIIEVVARGFRKFLRRTVIACPPDRPEMDVGVIVLQPKERPRPGPRPGPRPRP